MRTSVRVGGYALGLVAVFAASLGLGQVTGSPGPEATAVAEGIWQRTNRPNLRENIKPTRSRADLILEKGGDHFISRILLRRT